MSERQNNWPLLISLVLAVLVHLTAVQPMRGWMIGTSPGDALRLKVDRSKSPDEQKDDEQAERQRAKRDRMKVGQLDPSTASVMRLVTWDDAEKLLAHQSQVEQPAIQKDVDPDRAAQRTPVDPTPPAVARPNTTDPIRPAATPPVQAMRPRPAQPMTPPMLAAAKPVEATQPRNEKPTDSQKPEVKPGRLTPRSLDILALDSRDPTLPGAERARSSNNQTTEPGKIDKAFDKGEADSDKTEQAPQPVPPAQQQQTVVMPDAREPTQPRQPQPAQQPSPAAQQQPAAVPKPTDKPNPTVAAKSDFESPPVSEIASAEIHPGAVVSIQGVSIKTIRARYSVVALMTARIPHDPVFRVHFSDKGVVDNVEKLRSSGYDNVDGPIVTSLWKWRAEGKLGADGLTIRRLHILLGVDKNDTSSGDDGDDDTE
ncbi:MAG: hypothetical protein ACYC26_01680 [Phycisphaerales bacterium]